MGQRITRGTRLAGFRAGPVGVPEDPLIELLEEYPVRLVILLDGLRQDTLILMILRYYFPDTIRRTADVMYPVS